jgi:F420H(2)-dependent quinone reductase
VDVASRVARPLGQLLGKLLPLHNAIYTRTNGRIGHRWIPGGPPSLLLRTTGAKSGQARTTALAYTRDGDDYVIAASNGGAPRSPGWYYNLKANPDAEINVGPKGLAVTARPVLPGDPDYARLWHMARTNHSPRLEAYQAKTFARTCG